MDRHEIIKFQLKLHYLTTSPEHLGKNRFDLALYRVGNEVRLLLILFNKYL